MTKFTIHTKDTAPESSKSLIEAVQARYGMLPNLLAGLAEAPNVLKGYLNLSMTIDEGTLSPVEVQIVQMTASRLNGCHYCVAAHSTISDMHKLPSDVIEALRNDQPIANVKQEALRQFAKAVVSRQGWVSASELEKLIGAGYSKGQALEAILSVSLKIISNYANHIMDTPVDQPFQKRAIDLSGLRKAG